MTSLAISSMLTQARTSKHRGEREELPNGDGGGHSCEVPIHFALVTPRAGAHAELLMLLQTKIVAPLIHRRLLSEFRVLTTTPPAFKVEAATLVVFELTVPCPWPITDWDVRQWQRRLGSAVHLVVAPSSVPRGAGSWDAERARSALARAMVLPPAKKGPPLRKKAGGWIPSCLPREVAAGGAESSPPSLHVVEETSGRRVCLTPGATLMSAVIAAELCQHLPVSLRWRTSWRLVYSPRLHGVSLKTFYRRMESEGPSLLLVQDHCGCLFGGFATSPWHAADRYFGSGECFVFRFRRRMPKPIIPLLQHTQLLAAAQSGEASEEQQRGKAQTANEEVAMEAIKQAMQVLSDWHPKVRAEAERAERAAAAAGCVTSPTEALDEVLGRNTAEPGSLDPAPASPEAPPATAPESVPAGPPPEPSAGPPAGGAEQAPQPSPPPPTPQGSDEAVEAEDEEEGEVEAEGEEGDLGLEAFHWVLKDPFFLFSDMECLAMGGGSAFALYLEKDLLHGMSEPCSTFGSEALASAENFVVSSLECWVFDDPTEVERSP